ncbi:MAG TPA: c-type cytochrome [Candidatus Methanoperedens sp.]|nr:c-type cytochrome [Candidatus Methanoperedens sp.]
MGPPRTFRVALPLIAAALLTGCASRGREVFLREGCGECHRFRAVGGGLAPDLSDVATRRDAASIRAQITNPGAGSPASRMPAFRRLSWIDLRSLVAYLGG